MRCSEPPIRSLSAPYVGVPTFFLCLQRIGCPRSPFRLVAACDEGSLRLPHTSTRQIVDVMIVVSSRCGAADTPTDYYNGKFV